VTHVAVAVVVGVVIGRLLPPSPRRSSLRLSGWPLLAAGVVLQLAAVRLEGTAAVMLLAPALVCTAAALVANRHITGTGVVLVGVLANLAGVLGNGGMPVSPDALVDAGVVERTDVATLELSGGRHLERGDELAPWLGDIVPVPLPVAPSAVSFGDLIIAVGTADLVAHAVRRRRRPSHSAPRARQRARSMSTATPAHDWGTAPPAPPESPFHHSARPDDTAPALTADASDAANPSSPRSPAATQSRYASGGQTPPRQ
jgi:hypothetical protein